MLDGERYGHMHMCGDAHACMHGLILVVPFGRTTLWSYYPLVVRAPPPGTTDTTRRAAPVPCGERLTLGRGCVRVRLLRPPSCMVPYCESGRLDAGAWTAAARPPRAGRRLRYSFRRGPCVPSPGRFRACRKRVYVIYAVSARFRIFYKIT